VAHRVTRAVAARRGRMVPVLMVAQVAHLILAQAAAAPQEALQERVVPAQTRPAALVVTTD
jgi:hypothetical protein